mgnify:CR=1 FL=1
MIPTATASVICRALLPSSTISRSLAAMPCGSTPALIHRSRMRAMMCATTKRSPRATARTRTPPRCSRPRMRRVSVCCLTWCPATRARNTRVQGQLQARHNEYSDRFIWTDSCFASGDGMPFIGGETERNGTYILNFFKCQPALNYGYGKINQKWQKPPTTPPAWRRWRP